MATPPTFDKSASALGLITPETMKRFPAATYLLGKQAGSEAGLDVSDPRNVAKALQSRTANDRMQQATDASNRRDSRALNRILGVQAPVFGVGPNGTLEQNLDEGARIQTDALTRNMAGRNIVARQVQQENDRLAKFAEMDTAIDAREKKLKDKVLQGIERNLQDVRTKAMAARAIMRSQLGNMSPAQRNAVLASQGAAFTEQINNLESLRSAREGAIDSRVKEDRDALETQIKASEQRIKGLDTTIRIMEANNADASAIADIRVKLAQEREKLRKKTGGTGVTRKDIVYDALITQFRKTHANRSPNDSELKELGRQAELISSNRSYDSLIENGTKGVTQGTVSQTPGLSLVGGRDVNAGGDIGSSLEFAGYGIPLSRDEAADLQIQESTRQIKAAEAGDSAPKKGGWLW